MLTIGALARLAGTTTRTIRHYHAVGVLPEPARRLNGYREYDLRDAVRLVRVRRLVALGVSLPEVAEALSARSGADRDLRQVLTELDAELADQQRTLGDRRRRLAELLDRPGDVAASEAGPGRRAAERLLASRLGRPGHAAAVAAPLHASRLGAAAVPARRPRQDVTRVLTWAGPGLLAAELALVLAGRLSLGTAALVLVALEAALALVVVSQLAGGVRRYRRERAGGTEREQALQDALQAAVRFAVDDPTAAVRALQERAVVAGR